MLLGFGLRGVELVAQRFEGCFAFRAVGVFLLGQRLIGSALFMGTLFFALEAFEFQPRHRDPRVRAVDFLRRAANIVIERHGVLFAGLLQLAQPLQFHFERRAFPAATLPAG